MCLACGHIRHEDVRCERWSISQGRSSASARCSESSSHALCYQCRKDESRQKDPADDSGLTETNFFFSPLLSFFVPTVNMAAKKKAGHCCKMPVNWPTSGWPVVVCASLWIANMSNPLTAPSSVAQ